MTVGRLKSLADFLCFFVKRTAFFQTQGGPLAGNGALEKNWAFLRRILRFDRWRKTDLRLILKRLEPHVVGEDHVRIDRRNM